MNRGTNWLDRASRKPTPTRCRSVCTTALDVTIHLSGGSVASASIDAQVKYAGLGNRLQQEWPPKSVPTDHLPIDLKPIWMRAPRRIGTKTRHIDGIQLFIIHNTGADSVPEAFIGPDINQFIVDFKRDHSRGESGREARFIT